MISNSLQPLEELPLFDGESKELLFANLVGRARLREMPVSSVPREFPVGDQVEILNSFEHGGTVHSTEDFLVATDSAALLVLHRGQIVHEQYALTGGPDVPWMSFSVAKSFVSALMGAAIEDGHVRSVDDKISDYIPVQPGSGYDGVAIRDVLQMSSGVRWTEDYTDEDSDAWRLGGDLDEFIGTHVGERAPGTLCRYCSADTQALGWVIRNATGRSLADYMTDKLVEPLGFTNPSYWLLDSADHENAFAGLYMTARDFAKLAELYRLGGSWKGRQILPESWVRESTRVTAPHCEQIEVRDVLHRQGYGYKWWVPPGGTGAFAAMGAYYQMLYVDPAAEMVVVKLSADRRTGTEDDDQVLQLEKAVALAQGIAQSLS